MPDSFLPSAALAVMTPYHTGFQLLGILGSVIYVGGYLLVQCGHLCGNSAAFTASKLLAACLVLLSLGTAFNVAAFVIQTSFIVISVYGLWYRLSGRFDARRARLAPIDTARFLLLADDSAQVPGPLAGTSPIAPEVGPGTSDYRDILRWPGPAGGQDVA